MRFRRRGGDRVARLGVCSQGPAPRGPPSPEVQTWAASGVRPRPAGPRGPRPPCPPSSCGRAALLAAPSPRAPPLPLPSSPALPRRGDASAWAGRVSGRERGGKAASPGSFAAPPVGWEAGPRLPARGAGASAAAARPPGACGERERERDPRGSFGGAVPRPRGPVSRPSPPPLPLPGADRSGAGPRDAAASVRRRDLPPGCGSRPAKERSRAPAWAPPAPSPRRPVVLALALLSSPLLPSPARAHLSSFSSSGPRPQIRRGDPLNLSILVSGGKETNQDSLSNGE